MKAKVTAVGQLGTINDFGMYEALVHTADDTPSFWKALLELGYENGGICEDSDESGYDELSSVVASCDSFRSKSDFIKQLRADVKAVCKQDPSK